MFNLTGGIVFGGMGSILIDFDNQYGVPIVEFHGFSVPTHMQSGLLPSGVVPASLGMSEPSFYTISPTCSLLINMVLVRLSSSNLDLPLQ